jgi:hypothetical protein
MLAPSIQRFSQSNLTDKAGWILRRLVAKYPNRNEQGWANQLRFMCGRNDCLFVVQSHSVALAEVVQTDTLSAKRVVYERFVWCEDRQSPNQVEAAAEFYTEFVRWANSMGIDEIVIDRDTDVPLEMIRATLRKKINVSEIRHVKV